MSQEMKKKPLHRVYAVGKREEGDTRKASWIEIGTVWATAKPGITRMSTNDAYEPLVSTGNFDIMMKAVD